MSNSAATPEPPASRSGGGAASQQAGSGLGLALSGGGVRAALFSLGVIVGLIQTGCHWRVRCIASVSGGSILNAALAHTPALSRYADVEAFEGVASRLAGSLAWTGVFAFGWRFVGAGIWLVARLVWRSFFPVVFGVAFLADQLRESGSFDVRKIDWGAMPWDWVAYFVLAVFVVTILFSRGLLQEAAYRSILHQVAGHGKPLYLRDWGTAAGADEASAAGADEASTAGADGASSTGADGGAEDARVMHVLVATDLLSGEPIYFSSRFVYCRPYGWSPPGDLRTPEALYSSAAFPGVFPPKRIRLRPLPKPWGYFRRRPTLDFRNGDLPGELPPRVELVDGGVYNNLGYDWFGVLRQEEGPPPPGGPTGPEPEPPIWPYGELDVGDPPQIDEYIVVNAGAPSRSVRRVRFLPLARIISVLYDNTVRPRVEAMRETRRPLIDIKESPLEFARRLEDELGESGGKPARDLAERLDTRSRKPDSRKDRFWEDFSRDTAGTKTKLSPAGRRTGARLMLHGYLSTLVMVHSRFGAALPKRILGEEYFLELVDGDRSG